MTTIRRHIKILALLLVLLIPLPSTASALAETSSGAGGLDMTFGANGKIITSFSAYNDVANALALQPNGKIIAAGTRGNMFAVARYNSDGVLDSTFGTGGKKSTKFFVGENYAESGNAVLIQPDNKIVVAGTAYDGNNNHMAVVRYNSNGSVDTSFDGDGKATTDFGTFASGNAAVLQTDGKIVIAGYANNTTKLADDFALMRYNADGSPDSGFGTNGQVTTRFNSHANIAHAVAIQPDGKIIAVGYVDTGLSNSYIGLARYNDTDGSLDTSFGTNGMVITAAGNIGSAITLQPDGKIIVAGSVGPGFDQEYVLLRYNSEGTLDNTFGHNGRVITNQSSDIHANAVALQADGKIVVVGYMRQPFVNPPYSYFRVARYNPDGSPDKIFGFNGYAQTFFQTTASVSLAFGNAVVIQPNGKIIVAGHNQRTSNEKTTFALARYDVDALTRSFVSRAAQDGWILESGEKTGTGGTLNSTDTTFKLGDDAPNRQYRAILSFDTSSLPDNAHVQMIALKIKQSGPPVGANPFNILGNLWNDAMHPYFGNGPTLELEDLEVPASSIYIRNRFDKTPVNGWYTSSFTSAYVSINTYGLTQFRLYFATDDNNNNAADFMNFMSGNAAAADRPQLLINYYIP